MPPIPIFPKEKCERVRSLALVRQMQPNKHSKEARFDYGNFSNVHQEP